MRVVLISSQPELVADLKNWRNPDLLFEDSLQGLQDILASSSEGVLCFGPDLLQSQGLQALEASIKLAGETAWRLVVLSSAADVDTARLYDLGVDDVMLWTPDRSDNYRVLATLLQRPVYKKQTVESSEADILAHAGIVSWVFDTRRWVFSFISRNIEQLLGYSAENWYRRNYSFKLVHPDDRRMVDDTFRKAVTNPGIHEVRNRMLASGGKVVWVRSIINVENPGLEDVPKVTGIMLDVSEEHRQVQDSIGRVERSRTEIEQHLNRAPIAVLKANADLEVSSWSPGAEMMFGRTEEEVLGKPWSALGLIHPEDESRVVEELLPLINGQVRYQEVRNRNLRKDGSVVYMHWVNSCLRNADGTLQSLLSMGRDASAEVAMENHRHQQARMDALVALSSGIAHDFNNLLTPVLINAEQIQTDRSLGKPVRDRGEQIRKSVLRAREIITALLHINKPMLPDKVAINTARFVTELQSGYRGATPGKTELYIDTVNAPTHFMADENMLFQAVVNLVNNAIHVSEETHTPVHLKISLAGDQQQYVVISVKDEGPGIPLAHHQDIFMPFFTTKRGGKGSGLGLAMVKQICEAHEGSVQLESVQGQGAEFRMVIPFVAASAAEIDEQDSQVMPPKAERDLLRVALVEDEPVVLETLEAMLEALGHQSSSFLDSTKALSALLASPQDFDLIISDHIMPLLTGVELARKLEAASVPLPIVLVTGTAEELMRQENLPGNIKAILEKPMTYREFQTCLDSL